MPALPSLVLHAATRTGAGRDQTMDDVLTNWRRSIRSVGGFWQGTADYDLQRGTLEDAQDIFLNGLMRRFTESAGNYVTWEGYLAEAALTLNGTTYTRSTQTLSNALRCIYTRITDNAFMDGDAEGACPGTWTACGVRATVTRVTTWSTHGTYSAHCVVTSGSKDNGILIEDGAQTPSSVLTIVDETAYQCRASVKVDKGTWVMKVQRTDTSQTLAKAKTSGCGECVLTAEVPNSNTYVGTVKVILIQKDLTDSGDVYIDNALFTIVPVRAETTWYTDAQSITDYGRIEDALLEGQMTNAAALAKVQKELARRSWPRTYPPDRLEVAQTGGANGLSLTFLGYAWTLNWKYTKLGGENDANIQVAALVGESDYVTAGAIQANTMLYLINVNYPMRIWEVLKDLIEAGDSAKARWEGGVYAGRVFHYRPVETTPQYHYRAGRLLTVHGNPVDPWMARPGMARLDEMPVGPGSFTDNETDDPRNLFIDEVEFIAPDGLSIQRAG